MHLPNIHLLIVCWVFISTHSPLVLGFSLSFNASFIHLFTHLPVLTYQNLIYSFFCWLCFIHSFFHWSFMNSVSQSVSQWPLHSFTLHSIGSFIPSLMNVFFVHHFTHLFIIPHFTHLFNSSCNCQFSPSSFSSEWFLHIHCVGVPPWCDWSQAISKHFSKRGFGDYSFLKQSFYSRIM